MNVFAPNTPKFITDRPAFSEAAYKLACATLEYSPRTLSQLAEATKGLPEIDELFFQALHRGLYIAVWESCLEQS